MGLRIHSPIFVLNVQLIKTISRICGSKTPERIVMKFCMMVGLPDIVTRAKLDGDRFSHFRVVGGRISGFPIDFDSRPYNTLALPCHSVILTYIDCDGLMYNYTHLTADKCQMKKVQWTVGSHLAECHVVYTKLLHSHTHAISSFNSSRYLSTSISLSCI